MKGFMPIPVSFTEAPTNHCLKPVISGLEGVMNPMYTFLGYPRKQEFL